MPNPSVRRRPIYQEPVVRSISAPDELGHVHFELSVARLGQLPPDRGSEVAFAGRSNAGKSSALNAITGRKGLARISKTPGRTRLLNFFRLEAGPALVDLPGYGYARVAAEVKAGWDELLGGYLKKRRSLLGVILVMDCRHPLNPYDQMLLDFCRAARRPVHVLLSKSDKLTHSERLRARHAVERALAAQSANFTVQLFSAQNGEGVDAARRVIGDWLGLESTDKKNPGNKGKDSGAHK
jgi:GTP-binding protein